MDPKLLRLFYVLEFLIAIMAIFTAWSEIGGQAALDLMNWGFKLGLGLLLAGSIVGYSAALAITERLWDVRSLRWLAAIVVIVVAMGVVTYFYVLQEEAGESDETGIVSLRLPAEIPGAGRVL
jgi:hypothetical protein